MADATKAEIIENLLPPEILNYATEIVVNENGNRTIVVGDPTHRPEMKENTVTIVYNIPLDSALNFMDNMRTAGSFGMEKPIFR